MEEIIRDKTGYRKEPYDDRGAVEQELKVHFPGKRKSSFSNTDNIPSKEYTGKSKMRKKQPNFKRIAQLMAIGVASLTITIGGVKKGIDIYNDNKAVTPEQVTENEDNKAITLEEVTGNDEYLERLGITQELVDEILDMKERVKNAHISNEDIEQLGKNVENVQVKVLKTKLAKVLEVDYEDITVKPTGNTIDSGNVRIIVKGEDIGEYKISGDIGDQINNLYETQMMNDWINKFDEWNVREEFKNTVETIEKFALQQMTVNGENEISMDSIENRVFIESFIKKAIENIPESALKGAKESINYMDRENTNEERSE